MLIDSMEQQVYKNALEHFELKGTPKQIQGLQSVIRQLCSVQSGRQVIQKAVANSKSKISIEFNENMTEQNKRTEPSGAFFQKGNRIELVPISTDIPEMTPEQKISTELHMASILAHELQHASMNKYIDQLCENANNRDALLFACRLVEANAYLRGYSVHEELDIKFQPQIQVYQHPDNPKGRWSIAKGPNDPNLSKYPNKTLTRVQTMNDPKRRLQFLQDALSGKQNGANHSADNAMSRIQPTKKDRPSNPQFYQAIQTFLTDMQFDMPVDQVLAMGNLPPQSKQQSLFSRLFRTR